MVTQSFINRTTLIFGAFQTINLRSPRLARCLIGRARKSLSGGTRYRHIGKRALDRLKMFGFEWNPMRGFSDR